MKQKLLTVLLTLALIAGMAAPVWAAPAGLSYVDANGAAQSYTGDYTVIAASTTAWTAGWYAVESNMVIESQITVSGAVHLVLCDGKELRATGGIVVAEGGSLTVYGQTAQSGKLTVNLNGDTSGDDSEGSYIGYAIWALGDLTVNGGDVTAVNTESMVGVGIVSGNSTVALDTATTGASSHLTLNRGKLTARGGGYFGMGILCGNCVLKVNGGALVADGGTLANPDTEATETMTSIGILAIDSSVTLSGGETRAAGGAATMGSNGFFLEDSALNIEGGQLIASGGAVEGSEGSAHSIGIYTNGTVTISGEETEVIAAGSTAKIPVTPEELPPAARGADAETLEQNCAYSCGIFVEPLSWAAEEESDDEASAAAVTPAPVPGNVVIRGAAVTAAGADSVGGYSYGVFTEGSVLVDGGMLLASAGAVDATGDFESCGVRGGRVTLRQGTLIAKATAEQTRVLRQAIAGELGLPESYWWTKTEGGTLTASAVAAYTQSGAYAKLVADAELDESARYTVTFDVNGGDALTPATARTDTAGKLTLSALPTPIRGGYRFEGWYTARTGGEAVLLERVYGADTTVYARWTPADSAPGGTDGAGPGGNSGSSGGAGSAGNGGSSGGDASGASPATGDRSVAPLVGLALLGLAAMGWAGKSFRRKES